MNQEDLFREALETGRDAIYRICCCYVRDLEDRKDVFQEVLFRVHRHIGSFQGKSALKTWLYRIAVNTCLDFQRRRKRHEKNLDRSQKSDLANISDPCRHGNHVDGSIDIERMYACIGRLPLLDRTLVSLYLEDASTREMAEVMGISEANVRVKLSRIREALRQMLEGNKNGSR
jgi:RNA polymerase sigma-70 factor (ECF subfamily)